MGIAIDSARRDIRGRASRGILRQEISCRVIVRQHSNQRADRDVGIAVDEVERLEIADCIRAVVAIGGSIGIGQAPIARIDALDAVRAASAASNPTRTSYKLRDFPLLEPASVGI